MTQRGLFEAAEEVLGPGAVVLRGFALGVQEVLLAGIAAVSAVAPFRQMVTPGGFTMSAAVTSCGEAGWVSDRAGYRYAVHDPLTGLHWPAMPEGFAGFARGAAEAAGFGGFRPNACLMNRYLPGARMSLHQDKQERAKAPVVSVSLGLSAVFLWGGMARGDRALRVALHHGDVAVWGGESRMNYHGIAPLKAGAHPVLDGLRYNITFREI